MGNSCNKPKYDLIDSNGIGYIKTKKLLGRGVNGPIYKWINENKKEVVIKELSKSKPSFDHNKLLKEINILKMVKKYKSCITYVNMAEDELNYYIISEYIPYEDLFDYNEENMLTLRDIKKIFKKICLAVKQLHDNNIAHLDLKLENIIYNRKKNKIILIDFGYSSLTFEDITEHAGTLDYAAPEIFFKEPYDGKKADIWSLGVILYCLITGKVPFSDMSGIFSHVKSNVCNCNYNSELLANKYAIDLIKNIFILDACKRFNINQIIDHNFLSTVH